MNQEKVKTDAVAKVSGSNLLRFDEDNKVSSGKDINTKITALDTGLEDLRAELVTINNSIDVSEKNGTVKYVLLSGSYATQQQAMAAIKDMPGYIDMKRPQVRRLEAIQDYIAR